MIIILLLLVLIAASAMVRAYITEKDRWLIVAGVALAITFILIGTIL